MKIQPWLRSPLTGLLLTFSCEALSPGDLMFVGFNSQGDDSFSFVTWVELPANETILFMDGRYDGGGDQSGEGIGGGYYESSRPLYWTNGSTPLAAGSVVVLSNLTNTNSTPSIGSSTGGFALTNQGEQFFIAQGTIEDDNGNDYLDGTLLFGLDYEGTAGWTGGSESELPTAIEDANENISFAHQDALEFSNPRNNFALAAYPSQVTISGNWSAPAGSLSSESFVAGNEPPVVTPDELGEASEGLWFHTKRLNNGLPILDETWMLAPAQGMHPDETDNINGPSCIRLPSWLPAADRADPTAVYYLYFANHQGKFIRMAWAANIEGPWTGFQLDDSLPIGDRGVLSLGSADTILPGNGIEVKNHIASPQVFVDDVNQRFIMYYHGPTDQDGESRGQSTLVATSSDGLNFNLPSSGGQTGHGTRPVILGESYFRVFEEAGNLYAFSNTGDIWESPDPLNPWTPPAGHDYRDDYWVRTPSKPFTTNTEALGWPDLRPRHFAVLRRGDVLYAFLTNKDARPERILAASFDFSELDSDYNKWTGDFPHQEILRAEETWEGSQFPELPSQAGAENSGVNQLRDPEVFEDSDGRIYLFYSGQGEDAIGLAQLVVIPQVTGNTEVTTGQDEIFTVSAEVDVTNAVRKIEHTTPIAIDLDAEGGTNPFTYAGNGNYNVLQNQSVNSGSQSFQLAHLAANQSETLTFPGRYYAHPGATLSFQSRLGASTDGQLAEVQISFDEVLWQSIWQRVGGSNESSFSPINLALDGLEGRTFGLRFRYIHQNLRNNFFTSGSSAGQGWFFDEVVGEGFESATNISEVPFTDSSFSLDDIASILSPYLSWDEELEDRFLLSVSGLHDGESTGYGKPFVIRVRSSYEDFLATYFDESEQADPLISGLDADPEGDGLTNLMEHAFGTDPDVVDNGVTEFGMTPGASPAPFLSFKWNPDASVRYYLQMSPDLDGFDDILSVENSSAAGSLLDISLSPDPSLLPLGDRAFFRLRIEAQ